jgi:TolB-like protein
VTAHRAARVLVGWYSVHVSEEIMKRIVRFCLLALAMAGASASIAPMRAQSAAKPTVAIMFFNNNAIGSTAKEFDGLSKGIPDFLITDMAGNPNIRVIERDQVQKLIDEQKLVTGGQVDRETAVRIGKLLGAQHMIFGGFMNDPKGNFRIDARAVNVESSEIEYTERVQDRADNIMALIEQLAGKMNAGMKLPGRASRSSSAGPSKPLPIRVAVLYGKALDMADRGDKTRAVELYNAVLKEFPDYPPAQSGLAKVKGS